MDVNFTSDFFDGNRQRLRRLAKVTGPIVITANGILQRSGDNTFAFAQDSYFWYLTGIDEPDVVLVIDGGSEYLIVPDRGTMRTVFDGAVDLSGLAKRSGVNEILDEKVGWPRLKASLKSDKNAATLGSSPSYDRRRGFFANPARARLVKKLKRQNPSLEFVDLREILAGQRMIKQPLEIAAVQKAIDITARGIEKVSQQLDGYKYEYEIEASLTASFRASGASGHAFSPIVASGQNACTLHNEANASRLGKGDLVLLDVGAEVSHYAADITRTIHSGQPSIRQRAVLSAAAEVQQYAFDLLKPGIMPKDYEQKVEHFMGQRLLGLKLIKTASRRNIRRYYPHATSHFLGLDPHDVGDYRRPLAAGVILTVEPGIYIPEEGIGVRLEDNVLITASGAKNLSAPKLPASPI